MMAVEWGGRCVAETKAGNRCKRWGVTVAGGRPVCESHYGFGCVCKGQPCSLDECVSREPVEERVKVFALMAE